MWQIANHNYMWMKLIDSRFVSVALVIIISRSGHTRYKNYWSGNGTQDLLLHVVFGYCRQVIGKGFRRRLHSLKSNPLTVYPYNIRGNTCTILTLSTKKKDIPM